MVLVKSKEDLQGFLATHKPGENVAAVLSIEGLHALDGDFDNLQRLYDSGFRMMGLTHFFDNEVGGSAHGVEKNGLTAFGHTVVQEMERLGIIVDLAHASEQLMDDVLAIAEKPVVISHGGVRGTCDRNRNISDRHLDKVAAGGGLIGVGYWDEAVCERSAKAVVDAIDYVVQRVGIGHAALGADFDGAVHTPFDVYGIELVIEEMKRRGYAQEDIALISGGNVLRLLGELLPSDGVEQG